MFKSNALAVLSKYLDEHPETDLVSSDMDVVDEKGTKIRTYLSGISRWYYPVYLTTLCNVGASFMYRKSIADKVGGYDEKLFCVEDYDYWCRIALVGRIDYINDNLYIYRVQRNSLSATKKDLVKERSQYVRNKNILEFCEKYKLNFVDRAKLIHLAKAGDQKRFAKYMPLIMLLALWRVLVNLFSVLFFFSKTMRRAIREFGKIRLSNKAEKTI
jgi:GT2 family glycosyltransferase